MLLERCSYCAMVCASINFSSVLWRPRTQVPLSGGRWCYVFFFFLACDNSLVHLTSINISLRPQEEPLLIRHNICLFYFVLLISLISRKKHVLLTRTGVHCLVYHLPSAAQLFMKCVHFEVQRTFSHTGAFDTLKKLDIAMSTTPTASCLHIGTLTHKGVVQNFSLARFHEKLSWLSKGHDDQSSKRAKLGVYALNTPNRKLRKC